MVNKLNQLVLENVENKPKNFRNYINRRKCKAGTLGQNKLMKNQSYHQQMKEVSVDQVEFNLEVERAQYFLA